MHIRKKTSTFFEKKIDFIYQLRYYLCARWEFTHKRVYRWWLNEVAQPCFQKKVWVSVVWAAFRERNFEVGEPFLRARSVPSTVVKISHIRKRETHFFNKKSYFISFSSPNPLSSPFVCHLLATYLHRNLIGISSEPHRNLTEWWAYHQAAITET